MMRLSFSLSFPSPRAHGSGGARDRSAVPLRCRLLSMSAVTAQNACQALSSGRDGASAPRGRAQKNTVYIGCSGSGQILYSQLSGRSSREVREAATVALPVLESKSGSTHVAACDLESPERCASVAVGILASKTDAAHVAVRDLASGERSASVAVGVLESGTRATHIAVGDLDSGKGDASPRRGRRSHEEGGRSAVR